MTEEEIKAIETHTEIHAKGEPRAIKITEILRKAVRELRENKHLEEEMEIMTDFCGACKKKHEEEIETLKHNKKTVAHLSSCISDIQKKKIADLEQKLEQTEKDLADYQFNYPTIKELEQLKEVLKDMIANSPDTYSGTDAEFAQKRMFKYQAAMMRATELLEDK